MTDRCVAAERCLGYDHREKLAAEAPDGPLCEDELLAAERAVQALVWTYGDLEQHIPQALSSRGDGQPGRPSEHPVPINLSVEAAQREIHQVLTVWEGVLRDVDRLSVPEPMVWSHWSAPDPRTVPGVEVQRAARIIAPRVRLLARIGPVTVVDYPEVDDDQAHRLGSLVYSEVPGWRGVLDFARLHRRAQHQLGLTAVRPELCDGVPCKSVDCDMKALYREPGADAVRCGACARVYTAAEYRDWVKLVSAHVGRKESAA